MDKLENNQCPNCKHAFSDKEMLFWRNGKENKCPDCGVELETSKGRNFILWVIMVIAFTPLKISNAYQSPWYWAMIGAFFMVFGMISTRVQKIEIKNKS